MAKINILPSTHVTYDPDNRAIRSYFEPNAQDEVNHSPGEDIADEFLRDNYNLFKFEPKDLVKQGIMNTSGFQSFRYIQVFGSVPVYGGLVTVNIGKNKGNVLSLYNNYDYKIPKDFDTSPNKPIEQVYTIVEKELTRVFQKIRIRKEIKLFIFRYRSLLSEKEDSLSNGNEINKGKKSFEQMRSIIHTISIKELKDNELFLVWQFVVDVFNPFFTSLEVLVNSHNGEILSLHDLSYYVNGSGKVFVPDPVTASGSSLCTTCGILSPATTFDPLLRNVILEGLDAPDSNGKYHLTGTYCRISDDEPPTLAPPQADSPDFSFLVTDRHFLAVMSYYWIDTMQRYIHDDLDVPNAGNYQISIDPQGMNGADDSKFTYLGSGRGRIAFGEGGMPDAADAAGVIIHEYAHAIQNHQGFRDPQNRDLLEGFGDLLACLYRERYNPLRFRREEVFPSDNNLDCSYTYSTMRRMNLTQSYSDSDYNTYSLYLRGDIWANIVWQIYLALGGDSGYEAKRKWAADLCIKLHLMANVGYGSIPNVSLSRHQVMGEAFEMASHVLDNWRSIANGLFHKVIHDHYIKKGLFPALGVDIYINDGRNGNYDYNEWFWNCQDIVVRRNSTDSPTMGHQEPIVNQPSYVWVKIKKRGLNNPGNVIVKAFSCDPGTGSIWPIHWNPMTPSSLTSVSIQFSLDEWVGPFTFTPRTAGHECLLAIVEAQNDNANTQNIMDAVPVWMLVPFDNNIGQRNISPVSGGPGNPFRKFKIINPSKKIVTVSLDVNVEAALPKGWKIDFEVPNFRKILLQPKEEKWIKMSMRIPANEEIQRLSQKVRVTITTLIDGIPDGGMTFDFVHPSTL